MTELMVSLVIFALLLTGTLNVFIMGLRIWQTTSLDIDSMREASMGLEQMLYGATTNNPGLRQATGTNTTISSTFNGAVCTGWNILFCDSNSFGYAASSRVITNQGGLVLCTNVTKSFITPSSMIPPSTNKQVSIYIQVTQSLGSMSRINDLTTTVFFRN